MAKDLDPGLIGSNPQNLTNVNGTLYFTANDGAHGVGLWKSDGTAAGTVLIPGVDSPTDLVAVDGAVEFYEFVLDLIRSDGTATGSIGLALNNVEDTTPIGVTALPDGDFNGDSFSDILWQNTGGQASTWTVTLIPGQLGRRSERGTSTAIAIRTSCGRTPMVRPRSGR
jgi:ELWxxDGT repeat protein